MVEIRDIQENDRARWEELFLAYGVFYQTDFTPDILEGVWAWLMDDATPSYGIVSVDSATGSATVTGFALFRPLLDTFTARRSWFLDDLYVDPGFRGSGAATDLIAEVGRRAAGAPVRWFTGETNLTAQSIYNKVAKRTDYLTYEMET